MRNQREQDRSAGSHQTVGFAEEWPEKKTVLKEKSKETCQSLHALRYT